MANWRTACYTTGEGAWITCYGQERLSLLFDFSSSPGFGPAALPAGELQQKMLQTLTDTEAGEIVNPDEKRMAGHFWLRNPGQAPRQSISDEIGAALEQSKELAAAVAAGRLLGGKGRPFRYLAVIGIGGSQLGFQMAVRALALNQAASGTDKDSGIGKDNGTGKDSGTGGAGGRLLPLYLDNTDPESVAALLSQAGDDLDQVLFVVASKSGGTTEIRNNYTLLEQVYQKAGLAFGRQALAVTMKDSALDRYAKANSWLACVPVWDWVGGRFSVLSPVGLLPLALLGADIDGLLAGARDMDSLGRRRDCLENPPLLLASYFLYQTEVQGKKNMVILPYKDRLELWGRFLQQLVMESLGKTVTAGGQTRQYGITVFGNKGSTDQHSYIQQLLEGNDDFFAVLFSVLAAGDCTRQPVEDGGILMGDYLLAFCHATCQAFAQKKRQALLVTLDRLDAYALGGLIALYERAVGFYAAALGINPYHQPGVEAGKKSAQRFIALKKELEEILAPYIREQEAPTASDAPQRLLAKLKAKYVREERREIYYMLLARQANGEPAAGLDVLAALLEE